MQVQKCIFIKNSLQMQSKSSIDLFIDAFQILSSCLPELNFYIWSRIETICDWLWGFFSKNLINLFAPVNDQSF